MLVLRKKANHKQIIKFTFFFSLFCRWWKGPWQKCSKTCGKGISIRSVLCVRSSGKEEQVALKDQECAKIRTKPSALKSCFKEACPLAWTVGHWSKVCNKTLQWPLPTLNSYKWIILKKWIILNITSLTETSLLYASDLLHCVFSLNVTINLRNEK